MFPLRGQQINRSCNTRFLSAWVSMGYLEESYRRIFFLFIFFFSVLILLLTDLSRRFKEVSGICFSEVGKPSSALLYHVR